MRLQRTVARWVYRRWLARESPVTRFSLRHWRRIQRSAFWAVLVLYPFFCLASWLRLAVRRLLGLKPAVVWGPTPILTIAEGSAVLRRQGYPSTTVVFTTYHITSAFDVNLKPHLDNPAVAYWLPHALFLWSLLSFDVFHFFYDGGLWSGMNIVPRAKWLELPLLRLAGKRVIASAYGADVRVKALDELWPRFNLCAECPEPGKYCICAADRGAVNAKYYRDWCNVLLAMGDMHDYVPGSRMDFNYWPIDVASLPYAETGARTGPVKVVHSPNHRHFKGTRFIEAAVASLQAKGYAVELDLVEGVTNAEARRRYAEADIVVAQCVAGWMGYTEIEAMAAGKPVVGCLRNPDYLAHSPGCPLVSASPETVEEELERLVRDPELRAALGRRGRRYVEDEWSYEALGPRYDRLHREVWRHNSLLGAVLAKAGEWRCGEERYRAGRPGAGGTLGEWPVRADPRVTLDRVEAGTYGQPPFGPDGVPRVTVTSGTVDRPGLVARFALASFHASLVEPGTARHRERFLAGARWLRGNLTVDGDEVGRWRGEIAIPGHGLSLPRVAAGTHGVGVSVLLRAEEVAPGEGFARAARAAAEVFRLPGAAGGVLWEEDGRVVLEEYPQARPTHHLIGFLTALFALHELGRVVDEPWPRELFSRCTQSLESMLARYATVEGPRRDLGSEGPGDVEDGYFVVAALRALDRLARSRVLHEQARSWEKQLRRRRLRRLIAGEAPL